MQIKNRRTSHPSALLSRKLIQSLKAKADAKRKPAEKAADWLTAKFGNIAFLFVNILWFAVWIIVNAGLIPFIPQFDPFPFGLLTMIVSLEAIMLAIIVLISQNRAVKVDELREETDLQVDIITEQEITKLLELLVKLLEKNGIDVSDDKELPEMLKPTDTNRIQEILEKQVEE